MLFPLLRVMNVVPKNKEVQRMRIEFHRTGAERKALVTAIGEILEVRPKYKGCLLYTSDAADEL